MADSPEQLEAMFPRLDDAQVERLRAFGFEGRVDAGQIVFDQGDQTHGVFIVLDGSIQILNVSNGGEESLRVLERGMFTGEVNQLSGRRSLVRCRAREASVLLEIDRTTLRRIMQADAALGETFLRVFLMRRVY